MDFSGKTALITGGANGIGLAVVEGIIKGGGTAIIADLNMEAARAAQTRLGERAFACQMNLGDHAATRRTIEELIGQFKRIDILVNCGGVVSTRPFWEVDEDEWNRVININLTGTYTTCSALFPHMRGNGGGSIVNVSSIASKTGGGGLGTSAYASSKAGVNGLTKCLAREGGPFNIRCNAVCPAFTNTSMTTAISEDPARLKATLESIPLRRRAEPYEIANAILFMASDLSSFVTGEIADADGGITKDG